MKMNKQDAFDKFGTYLSVQVGEYDAIGECIGDFEDARENHTVGEDEPLPWIFENTDEGLAAAKLWAFEHRNERRTSSKFLGSIPRRNEHRNSMFIKIRQLRARLTRNKKFLQSIVDYDAETEKLVAAGLADNVYKIEVVRMKSTLELGNVPDIGSIIYNVTNMYGGVDVKEHAVTGYSTYGRYNDSKVDVIIHANYGSDGDGRKGFVSNDSDGNSSNSQLFTNKAEAMALAKKWATKIVADNSKWL